MPTSKSTASAHNARTCIYAALHTSDVGHLILGHLPLVSLSRLVQVCTDLGALGMAYMRIRGVTRQGKCFAAGLLCRRALAKSAVVCRALATQTVLNAAALPCMVRRGGRRARSCSQAIGPHPTRESVPTGCCRVLARRRHAARSRQA